MKLFHRLHPLFSVALLVFLVNGCVAVDSRAWKEPVDKNSLETISGRFQNFSSYRSEAMV
jgi:PBP1b-binding outer membrane lipoprotein LpoB